MRDRSITAGALVLFFAVAFGAFGAHGLKALVSPEALAQWKTAVEYQFYHGLGLLLVAAIAPKAPVMRWVFRAFVAGILLFCGSVYLLSLRELLGLESLAYVLGPVTPIGGLCLMAGWALLFITAVRTPDRG